ncbi:uncharacterized protein LOC134811421 isoform X3 [Bolinopsis microptera]|uniref:uncharacterized protein LOC134811421 isoform X3 n=1 Tax=Bolinopsis microptera TaxID=2820187 RepID=UPI003079589E
MTTLLERPIREDRSVPPTRAPRPVTLKPVEDETDKPRQVYRIRKSDYVKLPPIKPKAAKEIHRYDEDRSLCDRVADEILLDEHMLDIERYVKDLLPDLASHPAKIRETIRSPTMISETDLSLWKGGAGRKGAHAAGHQRKGSHLPISALYNLGQALLTVQQANLNRDLLEKEVEIKRILEQHRPILLRSLKNWRTLGKDAKMRRERLAIDGAGFGGDEGDSMGSPLGSSISANRDSALGDSALGDSALGLWESGDQDTDYLPSQRTLVTGEQERANLLHSLTEGELKEDTEDTTETESPEYGDSSGEADNEDDSSSDDDISPLQFNSPTDTTPSTSTMASTTPPQPTPVSALEVKQESAYIPSPEPDILPTPTPKLQSRQSLPAVSAMSEDSLRPPHSSDIPHSGKTSGTDRSVLAPSDDILGINAMLNDTDDEEKGEGELGGEEDEDEQEHNWSSEDSLSATEDDDLDETPPAVYVYKPKVKTPTPTPPPTPPPEPPVIIVEKTPTPPPPVVTALTSPAKKILAKPPARVTMQRLAEDDFIKGKMAEAAARAKQRAIEKALEKEMEEVMESQNSEELNGDENVDEILQRFTIVDKGRLNYLNKIFKDYQAEEEHPYLTHQEMKRALSQMKSCTKITRKQLKFIELLLGLKKEKISFHTFAVMATLIDHMSHKDPATLAMFDSIDLTRLEHDLPRLKRLFHCVSERDVFGWPKLTTTAMEIELLAACVPESTRVKIIKELDPDEVGEISIFDFILFTPFWVYLHDGIIDNPFREIEREVVSPVHRKWGVSVLWLPENHQNAREPRASPASGCGSERSTPPVYIEDPKMRTVQGEPDYSDEEDDDTEGIVNSDDED